MESQNAPSGGREDVRSSLEVGKCQYVVLEEEDEHYSHGRRRTSSHNMGLSTLQNEFSRLKGGRGS